MPVFKKQEPKTMSAIINQLVDRVNTDTERLRILEKNIDSIISRMNSLEQTMHIYRKDTQKSIDKINSTLTTHTDTIRRIENTLKEIITRMKNTATKTDIKEVEEMIGIFNPLKSSFITKEEVTTLIDKKLSKNNK